MPEKGAWTPQVKVTMAKGTSRGDAQGIGHHKQSPFLNFNPFYWWYGVKNVAKVRINEEGLYGPSL